MFLFAVDRVPIAGRPGADWRTSLVGLGYAAAPPRPNVAKVGEGGFGDTLSEFTTAVANKLVVVSVTPDNRACGPGKTYQLTYCEGHVSGRDLPARPGSVCVVGWRNLLPGRAI